MRHKFFGREKPSVMALAYKITVSDTINQLLYLLHIFFREKLINHRVRHAFSISLIGIILNFFVMRLIQFKSHRFL